VIRDISGYFGLLLSKTTRDLYMRWTEYAAFTPVMRSHEVKNAAGWTQDTDETTLKHFSRYSRIRRTLAPYFKAVAEEYETKGLPYMRHPYIHYENDRVLHSKERLLQYQYLLGRDLMVAPVCFKGTKNRRLYLPEDKWVSVWDGKEYGGGWITVDAPIGRIPLFCRKGSEYAGLFNSIKEIN
jgi:alpha-glucosidase